MKNFKCFYEMALKNLKVAPLSGGQDFVDRDVKAINNPVIHKKLEEVLARSTGFDFNIVFLEPNNIRTKENYYYQALDYCKKENIPLEGHITFAKSSSSGDPLTPWNILHTLGHALTDFDTELFEEILTILMSLKILFFHKNKINFLSFYTSLFQFKSAKSNNLLDFYELVNELIAEYLWHGFIRFKVPENLKYPEPVQNPEEEIKKSFLNIEHYINQLLEKAVGKIIIDMF